MTADTASRNSMSLSYVVSSTASIRPRSISSGKESIAERSSVYVAAPNP